MAEVCNVLTDGKHSFNRLHSTASSYWLPLKNSNLKIETYSEKSSFRPNSFLYGYNKYGEGLLYLINIGEWPQDHEELRSLINMRLEV